MTKAKMTLNQETWKAATIAIANNILPNNAAFCRDTRPLGIGLDSRSF